MPGGGTLKLNLGRYLLSVAAIVAAHGLVLGTARAQTRRVGRGLTPIASGGVTVLRKRFPKGTVAVRIYTATLGGDMANACPPSRFARRAYHAKRVIVVSDLRISVNGHAMAYVPTSAYAGLYDPTVARLLFDDGKFVLKVHANADGASGGYFVLLYFDSKTVSERRGYSELDERDPTEVTHYYAITVGQ
jgi:hypothetical protein